MTALKSKGVRKKSNRKQRKKERKDDGMERRARWEVRYWSAKRKCRQEAERRKRGSGESNRARAVRMR